MQKLILVTGNKYKLAEWRRLVPDSIELEALDIELDEIQSLDLRAIITDKVKRAYAIAQRPVVVEDVSAGLDKLGGLPGPFMKFFEKQLGSDALFQLAEHTGDPVTIRCAMAYYDGSRLVDVLVEVKGQVVPARGQNGFGFDSCFVLAGQTKTYAEMSPAEKDKISHRAQALHQLLAKLP